MKTLKSLLIALVIALSFTSCKKEDIQPTQTQNQTITYNVSIQHTGAYTCYLNDYNLGTPSNVNVKTGDKFKIISMQTFSSQTMRVYIDNVMVYNEMGTNLYYEKQF
jgi:hypothetical protein